MGLLFFFIYIKSKLDTHIKITTQNDISWYFIFNSKIEIRVNLFLWYFIFYSIIFYFFVHHFIFSSKVEYYWKIIQFFFYKLLYFKRKNRVNYWKLSKNSKNLFITET